MSKVFILQPTSIDIAGAAEYGEFVYLYDASPTNRMPPVFSASFALDVWRKMQDNGFDPDRDFLLPVGKQVPTILWVAAAISQTTYCRGLLYDAVNHRYVARMLGFDVDPDMGEHVSLELENDTNESESINGQRRGRAVQVQR